MDAAPEVSIIVTCRNNAATIGECLQALVDQDYPTEALEIIVVDAFSTDGTADIAKRYTPKVYVDALNAAAAYNYAQKVAAFAVLGFVDADAKVERDWLRKLVPHLQEPKVAGVSGAIETWNTDNPWARAIGYEIKSRYSRLGKYTGRIATMNLLLKRSVVEEVGGWDEAFPSQYDTDFGYRMSRLSYKIAYEPAAKCYHYNRPTVRAYWRQQLQYGRNTLRLYLKHGRLARGDEITDVGMNIQPALLLTVVATFLLGIVPLLRLLWLVSGGILLAMLIYYIISAARLSARFKDRTAMRLVPLYFVRAVAWVCGAAKAVFADGAQAVTKVCFISPEYWPLTGGTGSYVYYLSRELMKNGFDIHVVTGGAQAKDVQVNKQLSVNFLKIPKTPLVKSFLFAESCSRKLQSLRQNLGADVTHANLPLVPTFAVPADVGKAHISTVHSTWEGEANAIRGEPYTRLNANEKFMVTFTWFLRIFEERMMERSRKLIAVSDFTRKELTQYYGIPESKIRVIHNGVDTKKFQPAPDKRRVKQALGFKADEPAIVSVGRLYARKGLFTLIESIPTVTRKFPTARFIISGKGQSDEMAKLTAHAERLGVRSNIVFTGYYPDAKLPKLYQAADVFAFSTFYEHHPFAVLEALSTGLPVVTTNVGGIPETITQGRDGYMCQPFNASQFSERILELLEHPTAAEEMGTQARKTILERFDWRIVVKEAMAVYDEVLS